jgi:hypothetical protein
MKGANSARHQSTAECQKYTLIRAKEARAERQVEALEVSFTVDGVEIDRVRQFRYLGRILNEDDDDGHAARRQLARARTKWTRFGHVLQSDGVSPRVMAYFYKAVVQAVLL